MILAILRGSLWRKKRRKLLTVLSIAVGAAVCAGLAGVLLGVGDRIEAELSAVGANILVVPRGEALSAAVPGTDFRPSLTNEGLRASNLLALKRFFWRNNVLSFAPSLFVPASVAGTPVRLVGTWFDHAVPVEGEPPFRTGLLRVHPAWQVVGRSPSEARAEVLVGSALAERLGMHPGSHLSAVVAGHPVVLPVVGVVRTGEGADDEAFVPLSFAQRLAGRPDAVDQVQVQALTTPETRGSDKGENALTPAEQERHACTAYPSSIAVAIERAIPGSRATPVRRVAQTEGKVVSRIGMLMAVAAGAALFASVLGVMSAMTTSMLERRPEIGLMRSLGASDAMIAAVFLAEGALLAVVSGLLGFGAGWLIAFRLGVVLFGVPLSPPWLVLPFTLLVALGVAWLGSAWPLRQALRLAPTEVLHG